MLAALRPQADPPRRRVSTRWQTLPGALRRASTRWQTLPGAPRRVSTRWQTLPGAPRRASARRHTLPGAPRLTVVPGLGLCLESEAAKGEK